MSFALFYVKCTSHNKKLRRALHSFHSMTLLGPTGVGVCGAMVDYHLCGSVIGIERAFPSTELVTALYQDSTVHTVCNLFSSSDKL